MAALVVELADRLERRSLHRQEQLEGKNRILKKLRVQHPRTHTQQRRGGAPNGILPKDAPAVVNRGNGFKTG
jgi:hypothetical protein